MRWVLPRSEAFSRQPLAGKHSPFCAREYLEESGIGDCRSTKPGKRKGSRHNGIKKVNAGANVSLEWTSIIRRRQGQSLCARVYRVAAQRGARYRWLQALAAVDRKDSFVADFQDSK